MNQDAKDAARARHMTGGYLTRVKTEHVLLAIVGAAVAAVFMFGGDFVIYLAGLVAIYGISALGLDWLMGRAGQVSIGNAAFMAIGGYTTAFTATRGWGVFPIPLLLSGVFGALLGVVVGLSGVRLRGLYLALSTLALQFIVADSAELYEDSTGKISGFAIPTAHIGGMPLHAGRPFLALLIALLLVTVAILNGMYAKYPGRAWRAIRESEVAASAVGVDVWRWKMAAFVGSSALIAMSGSLGAYYVQHVAHDTYTLDFAISFVVMIIIGGMGSTSGTLLGACLITLLPYGIQTATLQLPDMPLTEWLTTNVFYLNYGVYGAVLLLFLLFRPEGLGSLAQVRLRPRRRRIDDVMPSSVQSADRPDIGPDTVLALRDVSLSYSSGATAVDHVSLSANRASVVVILGHNGAGKTSTLRAIKGSFSSEHVDVTGEVWLEGKDIARHTPVQTSRLGLILVPERDKIFAGLSVDEHIRLISRSGKLRPEIDELLQSTLEARGALPAGLLSGGQRQALALGAAWSLRPKVLMIDELSLGLAPVLVRDLMNRVREICDSDGIAVLLVEQNAVSALRIADFGYLLDGGRIVAEGVPADLARHPYMKLETPEPVVGASKSRNAD